MRKIKFEQEIRRITDFIRLNIDRAGCENAILGISGGIDSALALYLTVEAVGRDRVKCITLPYKDQSIDDAKLLVENKGIFCSVERITSPVDMIASKFINLKQLTSANIKSRIRMVYLYAYANNFNGMVIGTTNLSEYMTGYFTKHGDGGVDIEPIVHLYKTEVWEMSKFMDIQPSSIITKAPSAELMEGQTDEGEFGFSYAQLDTYLSGKKSKVPKDIAALIEKRIESTNHKREPAYSLDRAYNGKVQYEK